MNKVILMGRLTRDAEIRYAQGDNSLAIARFSLAAVNGFHQLRSFWKDSRIF